MYLVSVLLLTVVLPIGSIYLDQSVFHSAAPLMPLVGKWFVFWGSGIRLFLAGLRQMFQPRFTSEQIFGIESEDAVPFVRELGAANFATGTAMIGAVFYGIAGVRHAARRGRTKNENVATASDLFIFVVLAAYIVSGMFA